jgi:two-component system phosphate regulon sensor histidine kinase PhoR
MLLLTVIALILISTAVCFVFYGSFSDATRSELRGWADVFRRADTATALKEIEGVRPEDMRVTLVSPDGTVKYDNAASPGAMDNHARREEVAEALTTGTGESRRLSGTLGEETYYYAVRLADGNVLRAAKTRSSVWGMFSGSLPAVALVILIVFAIGYFMAKNLTRRIVDPINSVDLEHGLSSPYDEMAPFIRTIEKQREQIAEQINALQRRADTINAIMDNMREGIIFVDEKGVIISLNSSAGAILSADNPAEGKSVLEAVRDMDLVKSVREALSGSRGEIVKEYDGRTYRVFISPASEGGAIILLLDVTEKSMGEKLRREFSANVSHELKTPLTSIYGYAEMLVSGMVAKDDEHKLLRKIKDEAQRMNTLIQDIILVSRLDEGGGGDAFENVDLRATASEVIEALSLSAADGRISVRLAGDSACIRADRSMMYELFYNLIDNAIKYNIPNGKVNVDICRADDGQISVAVSDTGIGIPKESQARVFERFYRVDKSRSKKKGGTGLGLAIVKHIVLLHGGQVSIESREGEGTTMTATFPSGGQTLPSARQQSEK